MISQQKINICDDDGTTHQEKTSKKQNGPKESTIVRGWPCSLLVVCFVDLFLNTDVTEMPPCVSHYIIFSSF